MSDTDKLNPFQSLDAGEDVYGGYAPPEASVPAGPVGGGRKTVSSPKTASRTLPPQPAPPPKPSSSSNPFGADSAPPPPNPFLASSPPAPAPAPNPFLASSPPPPPKHASTYESNSTVPPPNPFIVGGNTPAPYSSAPAPYSAPSYSSAPYSGASTSSNMSSKEEAIWQREAELNRREQALAARERALATKEAQMGKIISRQANWPKWPKPILYHDISVDIPPGAKQRLCTQAYVFWLVVFFFRIWNLVVLAGIMVVKGSVGDFILAIVYILIFIPISFLIYRNLYQALRKGSSVTYFFFFFFFGIEILLFFFWGLGVRGSGMGGFLWMIWCFNNDEDVVGFLALINVAFWWGSAAFGIYIWIRARLFYKRDGGSMDKAQAEFNEGAVQVVADHPQAAANAVAAGY